MIKFHGGNLNFIFLRLILRSSFQIPVVSLLHTHSLPPHKEKPINWNSSHPLIQSNPLLSLLEKCTCMMQLKQIQAQMILTGLIADGFVVSRLVAFCAISQWRNLEYCIKIMESIENPNVFSWNVAIRGFSESENPRISVILYRQMLRKGGSSPDNYTYPLLFKVCASLSLICMASEILSHVLQLGFDSDVFVHNAIIHVLVSCGELVTVRKVFDEGRVRDLVSWNSMINGYVRSGLVREALDLYYEMEVQKVKPDEVTMIGVVSASSKLEDMALGRKLHQFIEENGLNLTIPLANALMDMYIKCRNIEAAKTLFENMTKKTIVTWTTMIVGYAKNGLMDSAVRLFNEMPDKNVVSWNALIGGFVQAKRSKEALALFHEMQVSNVEPDEVTIVSCLSACSQLGALDVGIWMHHYVEKHILIMNVALGTALVDMYAKCGNIKKALQVFWEMPGRNSLTWTAIICGLALNGHAHDAVSYFSKMIGIGLLPDEVTFIGVLSACCHGGLVDQGRKYFYKMQSKYNISPQLKHYSCMVDLLGRAGFLEEAEELIESMPIEADVVVWGALFFGSRIHGNIPMGEKAAYKLLELDPHDSGIYVLLANMYGYAKMWEQARKVRKMMEERGVEKTPGCSSVEMNGIVYEFVVRDKSHPQSKKIYECLTQLTRQMELVEDTISSLNGNYPFNVELGYQNLG